MLSSLSLRSFRDELVKISQLVPSISPPKVPGLSPSRKLTPLETNAKLTTYKSNMAAESDPLRRQKLFHQAKGEVGLPAQPLSRTAMTGKNEG